MHVCQGWDCTCCSRRTVACDATGISCEGAPPPRSSWIIDVCVGRFVPHAFHVCQPLTVRDAPPTSTAAAPL